MINKSVRIESERFQNRLQRERAARKQAEYLLENKSRELFESTRELRDANKKLERLANQDQVTGLPNRRFLEKSLAEFFSADDNSGQYAVLHIIDLNDFNFVAGTLGHSFSDRLLRQVRDRIVDIVGDRGTVTKIGSDEFAVLQTCDDWRGSVRKSSDKLITALSDPYTIDGAEIYCSASCGVAAVKGTKDQSASRLFADAESALHEARTNHRGSYVIFDERLRDIERQRLASREEIFKALSTNQYEVWLQPQVKLENGLISGYEALARWHHPVRGIVGPHEFIPTIEHMGLSLSFGSRILNEAFSAVAPLKRKAGRAVKVGVNLSAAQMMHGNLADTVSRLLREYGLKGEDIELEITEGSLIVEPDRVRYQLDRLRDMDISIALDDFGTGYSSLSYLRTFPIDRLKIDRSFIGELTQNVQAASIANAIVQMAKALGMRIVAEGIELPEQDMFLKLLGVDEGQGYLYSKPISKEEALNGPGRLGMAEPLAS